MSIDFREECYMILLAWVITNGLGVLVSLFLEFFIGMIIFVSGTTFGCLLWLFSVLVEIHIWKKNNKRGIKL